MTFVFGMSYWTTPFPCNVYNNRQHDVSGFRKNVLISMVRSGLETQITTFVIVGTAVNPTSYECSVIRLDERRTTTARRHVAFWKCFRSHFSTCVFLKCTTRTMSVSAYTVTNRGPYTRYPSAIQISHRLIYFAPKNAPLWKC